MIILYAFLFITLFEQSTIQIGKFIKIVKKIFGLSDRSFCLRFVKDIEKEGSEDGFMKTFVRFAFFVYLVKKIRNIASSFGIVCWEYSSFPIEKMDEEKSIEIDEDKIIDCIFIGLPMTTDEVFFDLIEKLYFVHTVKIFRESFLFKKLFGGSQGQ